jgi:hypothetical protein
MESEALDQCWKGPPLQGNAVRHPGAPEHCVLPVELGNQANRQATTSFHLGWYHLMH